MCGIAPSMLAVMGFVLSRNSTNALDMCVRALCTSLLTCWGCTSFDACSIFLTREVVANAQTKEGAYVIAVYKQKVGRTLWLPQISVCFAACMRRQPLLTGMCSLTLSSIVLERWKHLGSPYQFSKLVDSMRRGVQIRVRNHRFSRTGGVVKNDDDMQIRQHI